MRRRACILQQCTDTKVGCSPQSRRLSRADQALGTWTSRRRSVTSSGGVVEQKTEKQHRQSEWPPWRDDLMAAPAEPDINPINRAPRFHWIRSQHDIRRLKQPPLIPSGSPPPTETADKKKHKTQQDGQLRLLWSAGQTQRFIQNTPKRKRGDVMCNDVTDHRSAAPGRSRGEQQQENAGRRRFWGITLFTNNLLCGFVYSQLFWVFALLFLHFPKTKSKTENQPFY